MKVSTRARYGLRLMAQLARQYGQGFIFLKDIAREEDISEKYLGQLIIPLKAKGFILSSRGAYGGYMLAKDPSLISVKEIIEVLEGEIFLVDCVKGEGLCQRTAGCLTRGVWTELNQIIAQTLEKVSLQQMIRKAKNEFIERVLA